MRAALRFVSPLAGLVVLTALAFAGLDLIGATGPERQLGCVWADAMTLTPRPHARLLQPLDGAPGPIDSFETSVPEVVA